MNGFPLYASNTSSLTRKYRIGVRKPFIIPCPPSAGFLQVCLKGSAGEKRIIVIVSNIESAHLEEEAMQLSLSNGRNPDLQWIEVERPEPSKIAAWFNSITRKMKKGLLRFLDIISTKPHVQYYFQLEDIEGVVFAQIESGTRGEKVWL